MAEMTGRERFLTTIRREEPDRVPVCPQVAYFLLEYYGNSSWQAHLRGNEECRRTFTPTAGRERSSGGTRSQPERHVLRPTQ